MHRERPLRDVPMPLYLLFAGVLCLQVWLALMRPAPEPHERGLPEPPSIAFAQAAALGEPAWLSRALSLWLQNFDFQPGISLPLAELDYAVISHWLDLQLALDPSNHYPLLAALHLYGSTGDHGRVRQMLHWVARVFHDDPAGRWRYMAEAAVKARHVLGDLGLANALASELDRGTRGIEIPGWARQMHIFLKADLGQREVAAALLGALIESGEITRPEELSFLRRKLDSLTVDSVEKSTLK
jgi:hypothetical protein